MPKFRQAGEMLNRRNLRIKAMQTLFAWQQLRNSDQQIAWEQFLSSMKESHGDIEEPATLEKIFKARLSRPDPSGQNELPADLRELANQVVTDYQNQISKDLKHLRSQMLKEVEGINQLFLWILTLFLALADFEEMVISRKKSLSNGKQVTVWKDMQSIELIRQSVASLPLPSWDQHQDRLSQWYKEIKSIPELTQNQEKQDSLEEEVEQAS